jgi:protein-L-isoaspartate(D-aspartate) O-methyltransferase
LLQVRPSDVVLEIGTGSGYQAAVLAELAKEVLTIELIPELADRARKTLARLAYRNVQVRAGDGYGGWPERAPFPRIIVTAAPPEVPPALVDQLAVGGTMVVPVGNIDQELLVIRRTATGIVRETTIPVRFVPMIKRPRP